MCSAPESPNEITTAKEVSRQLAWPRFADPIFRECAMIRPYLRVIFFSYGNKMYFELGVIQKDPAGQLETEIPSHQTGPTKNPYAYRRKRILNSGRRREVGRALEQNHERDRQGEGARNGLKWHTRYFPRR